MMPTKAFCSYKRCYCSCENKTCICLEKQQITARSGNFSDNMKKRAGTFRKQRNEIFLLTDTYILDTSGRTYITWSLSKIILCETENIHRMYHFIYYFGTMATD